MILPLTLYVHSRKEGAGKYDIYWTLPLTFHPEESYHVLVDAGREKRSKSGNTAGVEGRLTQRGLSNRGKHMVQSEGDRCGEITGTDPLYGSLQLKAGRRE